MSSLAKASFWRIEAANAQGRLSDGSSNFQHSGNREVVQVYVAAAAHPADVELPEEVYLRVLRIQGVV